MQPFQALKIALVFKPTEHEVLSSTLVASSQHGELRIPLTCSSGFAKLQCAAPDWRLDFGKFDLHAGAAMKSVRITNIGAVIRISLRAR
jgi:hypothetical protein